MQEIKGVNLACGDFKIPGFINVDVDPNVHPDLVADIRKLPFEDGAVPIEYFGHGLEHCTWDEVIPVLEEAKRVLADDGEITVCVPDVLKACQMVEAGEQPIEFLQQVVMGAEWQRPLQRHNSSFTPKGLEVILLRVFPVVERVMWSPYHAFSVPWQVLFKCKKAPLPIPEGAV